MAVDRYLSINWAVNLWSIKLRKGNIQSNREFVTWFMSIDNKRYLSTFEKEKEKSKKMIVRFLVVLSIAISVPIAWFHRIAEAGNCRLVFLNEQHAIINTENMTGILSEISSILTVAATQVDDVPLIALSKCPRHPVDGHPYYNFFIISWSIGRRFKSDINLSL